MVRCSSVGLEYSICENQRGKEICDDHPVIAETSRIRATADRGEVERRVEVINP